MEQVLLKLYIFSATNIQWQVESVANPDGSIDYSFKLYCSGFSLKTNKSFAFY